MSHVRSCAAGLGLALFTAVTASPRTASLIEAVHKGHAVGHEQDGIDAVRAALAAGGDVNERDAGGWTPLMHAALECRAGIVKLLLDRGADPNLRANSAQPNSFIESGRTALLVAAGCFIARRRAELAPERHMPAGYAAYELAAPAAMVRNLIAHGARINAADANGSTALMLAAMHGWADAARQLLAAGAQVNARDRDGRLAIDYADPADRELADLLRKAGSDPPTGRSARRACDAERALNKRGYEMPITDCIVGQQFGAVLRKFQQDHALPPTGQLDPATVKALGIR